MKVLIMFCLLFICLILVNLVDEQRRFHEQFIRELHLIEDYLNLDPNKMILLNTGE